MFTNLVLKLKIFFLIAVVICALASLHFLLFRDLLNKVDVQQGEKNAARLIEAQLKNANYSLIENSFSVARHLKFEKAASKGAPAVISPVKSDIDYSIVKSDGEVLDVEGTQKLMSSYAGIPAVDRALKEGFASDGIVKIKNEFYLIGAAPVMKNYPGSGEALFAVVSTRKITDAFSTVIFPMPIRIYSDKTIIGSNNDQKWASIEDSFGKETVQRYTDELINSIDAQSTKILNHWTHMSGFSMPSDTLGGYNISVITVASALPSWESYTKVVVFGVVYAIAAILIIFLFTFITTHEINKILKSLAADISRLRVGEKLVIKKYSDGADIAVSALNTLITKYISNSEASGSSQTQELSSVGDFTAKDMENLDSLAKSFDTDSAPEPEPQHHAPQQQYQAPKPQQSYQPPKQQAPKPQYQPPKQQYQAPKPVEEVNSLDDDDNEKTQIAVSSVAAEANAESVYEALWNDFCSIKKKYGGAISPAEKTQFINRVKTNRVSIIAKYNCSDVQFSIEEKDRKPVVKAKPVFTK